MNEYIHIYVYISIYLYIYLYIAIYGAMSSTDVRTVVRWRTSTGYCTTCDKAGGGHIAVCGRRFGRGCMDKHAAGAAIIHGS